uniref:GRAM domain-containing protein n=1 Tax=Oncorhynchus kisutch TaxID=8019 RepID=A0A8C7IHP0_ONCKI
MCIQSTTITTTLRASWLHSLPFQAKECSVCVWRDRQTGQWSAALWKKMCLSESLLSVRGREIGYREAERQRGRKTERKRGGTPAEAGVLAYFRVLSPTYKQRNEDFRKLFKQLPDSERLIVDYSCALQRDILLQGRLYVSENWICFYSNIFRWETLVWTLEKTARLIPNAIQLCTDNDKHFFTSFGARDRTYMMMFKTMADALLEKVRLLHL